MREPFLKMPSYPLEYIIAGIEPKNYAISVLQICLFQLLYSPEMSFGGSDADVADAGEVTSPP